jgi:hypothetical protein
MSGRWVHKDADRVKFFIPNFVDPEEVETIKPWLPNTDITEEMVNKLQSFDIAQVPRNVGKPLIQKMATFWADADSAYQAAAVKMDNAHQLVAHKTKFSYASLPQIATRVLGDTIPTMEDGKFAYHVLYALHRTIMQDDLGFRPQAKQIMRGEGEYEINSLIEAAALKRIANQVRSSRNARIAQRRGIKVDTSTRSFDMFIKKARSVIDASRELRDFTEYGVLGPSKVELPEGSNIRVGEVAADFSPSDREWIYFLESWACLRSFHMNSTLSGIGSSILRAIGRYNDVPLDMTTAYTCLAELGVMPPWENQAAFELRLPYTSARVSAYFTTPSGIVKDTMAGLRKDWGDLRVYCIDDASASEIDDGISVELTDNPDEYWVHIHTADPAAHLRPDSEAAQNAELLTMSVYLPDRKVPMLASEWVRSNLSLGPKKPCLTYSVKMNLAGETLDINVTPGFIRNVVYLTKDVLHEAVFGSPPPAMTHIKVGKDTFEEAPTRPLLQAEDVTSEQKADFKLFHKLYQVKEKIRTQKGALKYFPSGAEAHVSFGGAPWVKTKTWGARYHGDPTIQIAIPPLNDQGIDLSQLGGNMILATMMLLANEASAQWCHARGIPVVNRISPFNPAKEDPLKFYREEVLPSCDENGYPKLEKAMAYLKLIGKTQPSTTPGPHLGIGAEMTMQATSPLRRFGDLLNQWQIEAAIREEARTGKSLIGNTKDDFLPYSKARIDALLPRLAEREAFIKQGQNKANREWILRYLVRAWKYGEDKLASPLLFYVRSVDPVTRKAGGIIPSIHAGGNMEIPEHMKADEVAIGDAFEVDIQHIDVYERSMALKSLRKISFEELDALDPSFANALKALSQRG